MKITKCGAKFNKLQRHKILAWAKIKEEARVCARPTLSGLDLP